MGGRCYRLERDQLRRPSPAMAAGIADTLWGVGDIVNLIGSLEDGDLGTV